MQGEKQLEIINFFGEAIQNLKVDEEFKEIVDAYINYKNDPSIVNLLLFMYEVNDLSNVLEGILIKKGGCVNEVYAEKDRKLNLCLSIIKQIPDDTQDKMAAYDLIRYA